MPKILPPGFIDVSYRWSLTGDPEEMVHTQAYALTGDPLQFLNNRLAAFKVGFPVTGWLSVYRLVGVTGYVGQDGGPPAVYEALDGTQGPNGSPAPPQNCALLVRKRTALGGRRGRGRMYLPPFPLAEGGIDHAGKVDPALVSAWTASSQQAFNEGVSPVLLHATSPKSPTPPPTPITSFLVDSMIATQRRRLRR
jgi:hypothetical protein